MNNKTVRILIWGAERLGDAIMTFPALKLIRAHRPDVHITYTSNDYAREIVEISGLVDEIFLMKFKGGIRNFWRYRTLRKIIRQGAFDHIFVFAKSTRFRKHIAPLSTVICSDATKCHVAQSHINTVIEGLSLGNVETPGSHIELPDSPEIDALFKNNGLDIHAERYIVFHPGTNRIMRSSNNMTGTSKARTIENWSIERFCELTALLHSAQPDLRVVCVGTENERKWLDGQLACFSGPTLLNLCGVTRIRSLLQLLKHAEAVVCGDSGVMHSASVVNTPTIALFGPTDENRSGAFGMGDRLTRIRAVAFNEAQTDNDCMNKISAQQVFDAIVNLNKSFS